jgi:hypothetical protein
MKLILLTLLFSTLAFAKNGGDDSGNGGFAYKQSIIILENASDNLIVKIEDSQLQDLVDHPERRILLQDTLNFDHLIKLPTKNASRGGRKLAMDYSVNPAAVKILKPYYEAFMGKTDNEIEDAALEVEKRLLHEASHIWGYNEAESEVFAVRFLAESAKKEKRPDHAIKLKSACSCVDGLPDMAEPGCYDLCQTKAKSASPILYLDTLLDEAITLNPKLGNLYNWCTVMLSRETTAPQCALFATSDRDDSAMMIPVIINPSSNKLTANISQLSQGVNYKMKIVEFKSSAAESLEFDLYRILTLPQEVGMNCSSDNECKSFCCHSSTGSCAPHDPKHGQLCEKEPGQSCIADSFCKSVVVTNCNIIKTGQRADGRMSCALRCVPETKPSACKNNICMPPKIPNIPVFDPEDCSKAVDP